MDRLQIEIKNTEIEQDEAFMELARLKTKIDMLANFRNKLLQISDAQEIEKKESQ